MSLTEKSRNIFRTALLRPVSVLQVPNRPLLAREQVFDLQPRGGVAVVLGAKLGGDLELAMGGRVVFGAQFGPVAVTLGPAALLVLEVGTTRMSNGRKWQTERHSCTYEIHKHVFVPPLR